MVDRSWQLLIFYGIVAILTALLSYFSAFLRELSETKLQKLIENGNERAKKLLVLSENDHSLESLRIGIVFLAALEFIFLARAFPNLSADLKNWIGLEIPNFLYRGAAYLLLMFVSGVIHSILVDFIPTKMGTRRAKHDENFQRLGILFFFTAFFMPLRFICNGIARGILRLVGVDDQTVESHVTEDKIMDLVDLGEESGNIESDEKEMIENIFDFTDITASNLMTHRTDVTAIDVDSSDEEIYRIIGETGFSRFPVYQNDIDHILGILNAKTYLLERASGSKKSLRKLLYKPYLVPETVHAGRLLSDLKKNKVHMAIVLDEYGGTLGIVTMEDLLEEIVGNIYDETDKSLSDQELIPLSENRWRAAGSLSLSVLSEEIGISFETESSDTLGGLIFSRLTLIPEDGERPVLDIDGMHVEVEEIRGRRVEWAILSKVLINETVEDEVSDQTL